MRKPDTCLRKQGSEVRGESVLSILLYRSMERYSEEQAVVFLIGINKEYLIGMAMQFYMVGRDCQSAKSGTQLSA